MKWLAAAAGLGVIIFSFGYAIYYIMRGGGCAGCGYACRRRKKCARRKEN